MARDPRKRVREPDSEHPHEERRDEAPAAPEPAPVARMLALQRTVGNAAVAAQMLGSAANKLARQPTTDEASEGDVVPDAINPDDRAWSNAVERLKTITRVIMKAVGRNDIKTILLQARNVSSTRYQLKAAAEAFPSSDIRRARYEEQSDHLYNTEMRLSALADPVDNGLSLWLEVGHAAGILQKQVKQDTFLDFKDQMYREAVWEVNKCERGLNDVVHDRPMDKTKLTVQHQQLTLAISRVDFAVSSLPASDPRRLARQEANDRLSSAQYRFIQLLSESVAAADIWDMLRIACDHIDPTDDLPPNPYDELVFGIPAEAKQEAADSAP